MTSGGGGRKETGSKSKRATDHAQLCFLAHRETPSSKLKIPTSFSNCLHTEAVLSANPSLKIKYKGGREGNRKIVHRNGNKAEERAEEPGSHPAARLWQGTSC